MSWGRTAVLGMGVLLVLAGVGSTVSTAAGTAPDLSLSIDSTTIENGDEYGTGEDPDLDIEASVGENASADSELAQVVVRLNGDRYRNFSASGDSFSKTVALEVDNGENSVRVIVTDSEGRATSTSFTVIKDDRRPIVYLTEPYQSVPYDPIGDGSTSGSWTTFNATIIDDSNATSGTMTIWWNDSNDDVRRSVSISDIGSNFSKRVFLGYGYNQIELTVNDEYGNTRIDNFGVRVSDGEPPTVALGSHPEEIQRPELFVSGNVTDDVWIDKAQVIATQTDGDERIKKKIRKSKDYTIDPGRTTAPFEKRLFLPEPGTYKVKVVARDEAGKWTNRSFRVERVAEEQRSVVPEISVDRDRTEVLDSETLFLAGRAFDGQIRRVVVETRDARTGGSIGYHPVFRGNNKESVTIEQNVTIQADRTEVVIRVTDAEGSEHTETFFVDGGTGETFVGNASGNATETETPDGVTTTVPDTETERGEDADGTTTTGSESDRERTTTAGSAGTGETETDDRATTILTSVSDPDTPTAGTTVTRTSTPTPASSSSPDIELLAGLIALLGAVGAGILFVVRFY